ncbi:ribosome rescue protein RqcH [Tardisphaera miroshnichenkoae]
MKTGLSAIDISAWITENAEEVTGSRVDAVFTLGPIFLFRIRTKAGDRTLVMRPGRYLYLTNVHERELPNSRPHPQLNQILRGQTLKAIEQVDAERIIKLTFTGQTELYLELFSTGQLAAVENGKIVYLLQTLRAKDRTLEKGKPYALPPARGLQLEQARMLETIDGPALASLTHQISFPLEGIKEALARANLPEDKKLAPDSYRAFIAEAEKLWERTKIKQEIRPVVIKSENGVSFHPFPFISDGANAQQRKTFNEVLEEVFSQELAEEKEEEAEKLERIVKNATAAAEAHRQKAQELKQRVELLSALAPSLSAALSELSALQKKHGWDALMPGEVAGLHLASKNPNGGYVIFEEAPNIPLAINKKIWDQIAELHAQQEEEERKEESAMEKIKELETKLSGKKQESEIREMEASMRVARKREWYERYRWFMTSDNLLVIGGKDADQNISIIRNVMKDGLWALHADVHGSPLAIIYEDAERVPETSINEAAQFVASYSKAWAEGLLSIKVSVFKSEQVSLSPPSGTFLSKGSFMIYGKKREIDAELVLSIGVEMGDTWFRVISGPPKAVEKRALAYVTIRPGDVQREKLVEAVRKRLAFKLRKLGSPLAYMIKDSDVEPLLPSGKGSIVSD